MADKTLTEIQEQEAQYNQASNTEIINEWHKRNQVGEYYLIDDKPNHTLNLYYQGNLIASFPAIHGKNSDPAGMMYPKYVNGVATTDSIWSSPDYATVSHVKADGKIDNLSGNLTTPAGIFYTKKTNDYDGYPAYMRLTPYLYESGNTKGVAGGIHAREFVTGDGSNTNGCTGISGQNMVRLDNYIKNLPVKVYVLPSDPNNKFQIKNNEIEFISTTNDPNIYLTKSTSVIPLVDVKYNKDGLSNQLIQNIDLFIYGLKLYKPIILEKLKEHGLQISSDVYDQLAIGSLSILEAESGYGKTNEAGENLFRFGLKGVTSVVNKILSKLEIPRTIASFGGADYISEYYTYKQNKDNNSIGPTSIRYNNNKTFVLNILDELNLTKDDIVNRLDYAAVATMLRLVLEYNDRGRSIEKAVKSWNSSDSYKTYLDSILEKRQFTGINSYPFDKQGGKLSKLENFLKYKNGGTVKKSPFTKDNLRNTFSAWFTDDQVDKMNQMYNHMKNSLGWSDRNIAAAFGNIMQETGFKYSNDWSVSPFGAFLFLGLRKKHFEKWANENGYKLGSLSAASYIDYIIKNEIDERMDSVLNARELAKTGNTVDSINAAKILPWAEEAIENGTFYPVADLTNAWADESLDLLYVTKLFANTIEKAGASEMNMNERISNANKIYSLIK